MDFTNDTLDRFDGLYAYDKGATDSGIKDDSFKAKLKEDPKLVALLLTALAKKYLNSNDHPASIEDISGMLKWAEEEFGIYF